MRWIINAGLPREDPEPEPDDAEPVRSPAQVRRMVRAMGWGEEAADAWAAHAAGLHDHERVAQPRFRNHEINQLVFLRWLVERGRMGDGEDCEGV